MKDISILLTLLALINAVSSANNKCSTWKTDLNSFISPPSFTLQSCDGKIGPIPASIPGSIHFDLITAGLISADPYYRDEELNISWVPNTCWKYISSPFALPKDYIAGCDLSLHLANVDSIGDVYFNDQPIGRAANALRNHTFLIPAKVISPNNHPKNSLMIVLPPTLQYNLQQAQQYPYTVPVSISYNTWAEPTNRNFLRKAGSDFGWDWGPAFLQTGISGGISFSQSEGIRLEGFTVQQVFPADSSSSSLAAVQLTVQAALTIHNNNHEHQEEYDPNLGEVVTFQVYMNDVLQVEAPVRVHCPVSASSSGSSSGSSNSATSSSSAALCLMKLPAFTVTNPQLWWPRNMMTGPYLYSIKVNLLQGQQQSAKAAQQQSLTKRIGIRTVELIQDPIYTTATTATNKTMTGRSFFVEINHVPVFLRGANFIPLDSFNARITAEDRAYILQVAQESHLNVLRVWGGGIYQPNDFYELADELGMMIWQEIMLACSMYPRHAAFLSEITEEVTQQALRLGDHPSIIVWGGNNENEVALYWYPESNANRDLFVGDYVALYGNTVFPALQHILGQQAISTGVASAAKAGPGSQQQQVIWVDSSPSNGLLSSPDPYVKRWGVASTATEGDIHYYNYDCDCEAYTSYLDGKFISEFGFQSMTSFLGYQPVLSQAAGDYHKNSSMLQYRQRHEFGNSQIENQILKHYTMNAQCSSSTAGSADDGRRSSADNSSQLLAEQREFDNYLYLTQLQQARCYEVEIARYRQLHGHFQSKQDRSVAAAAAGGIIYDASQQYTMGALYWQLNDIWQGPSWASMEWNGRWKALQSSIRRVFQPLYLGTSVLITAADATSAVPAAATIEVFLTNDDYAQFPLPTTNDGDDKIASSSIAQVLITIELMSYTTTAAAAAVPMATLLREKEVHVPVGSATPMGADAAIYHETFTDQILRKIDERCSLATCYLRTSGKVMNGGAVKQEQQPKQKPKQQMLLTSIAPLAYMKDVQLSSQLPIITFAHFEMVNSKQIRFEISVSETSPSLVLEIINDSSNNNNNMTTSSTVKKGLFAGQANSAAAAAAAGWFSENNLFAEAQTVYTITYTSYNKEWNTIKEFAGRLQARVLQHTYHCDLPFATPNLMV